MDTAKIEPDRPDNADDSHRCTLYLLRELSRDEAADFEAEMAQSPHLSDQLQRQAELLLAISELSPTEPHVPNEQRSSWTWVAPLLAVAASLALVFFGARSFLADTTTVAHISTSPTEDTDPQEELLIARAWVHGLSDERGERSVENGFAEIAEHDDVLPVTVHDELTEGDSALSWMFAAVSADFASLETEDES